MAADAARRIAPRAPIEQWLEAERAQLPLWLPVALGTGIAAWFALPDPRHWSGFILACAAIGLFAVAFGRDGRALRAVAIFGLLAALGCALVWWRAERVAAPVLARPVIAQIEGRIERIEHRPAQEMVRVRLAVAQPGLPPRIRINIPQADVPQGMTRGAILRLRARLMPPAPPALPGAYDFARVAWFEGIGASGRGLAPVVIVQPGLAPGSDLRERLSAHIQASIPGSAGGIAAALATGDRGAIADGDAEAMQGSGLAHLLSVSGLHITAVVGATMLIVLRLLALSPMLALRFRLPVIAAGAGALAAIGYTLLTSAL